MGPTLGLRHAVLWVSDPAASAAFYDEVLGLEVVEDLGSAVFMSSPASETGHDLGLFTAVEGADQPARAVGLYHLAWEVRTLAELADAKTRLSELGALVGENNHGATRSLYARDPDGIEFELMWEVPAELIEPDEPSNIPLDFNADFDRFGKHLPGLGGRAT